MRKIKKFTLEVEMQERWIPHFMSMLKYIEGLGSVGASRYVTFYANGDGDFNPKFTSNINFEIVQPQGNLEVKESVHDNGNRLYDAG